MTNDVSLLDNLAGVLPAGLAFRLYHISTALTTSPALFAPAPGQAEESTLCEKHFLGIALPANDDRGEILAYALEVIIFTTNSLTTIFVSKADSSGFLHLLKIIPGSPSIVRTITTHFLQFLIDTRPETPRLVLSLFARSQNQYLFPGSIENAQKHLLDDRQLIKWWCRTLDPIVRGRPFQQSGERAVSPTAHVIIPGCDRGETRAFFPASARQDPVKNQRWTCSYPVEKVTENSSYPLRCLIPRLPDDPKSRFLTELDGEHVDEQGHWKSVRTLEQFWEFLSYRQECAAGRLVGFIWVVLRTGPPLANNGLDDTSVEAQNLILPTESQSQTQNGAAPSLLVNRSNRLVPIKLPDSPLPSSPLLSPLADSLIANSDTSNTQLMNESFNRTNDRENSKSDGARGELILSTDDYDLLMEFLLELDFAGQSQAIKDTGKWVIKAGSLAKATSWGKDLLCSGAVPDAAATSSIPNGEPKGVNLLMGVRKKRKADLVEDSLQKAAAATGSRVLPATALGPALVRKKPKT